MFKNILKIGILTTLTLVIIGFGYEQISRQILSQKYPIQGKLVELGNGRKIQIDCRGEQKSNIPTVILESGFDSFGSLDWTKVQDQIAKTYHVCSYSRAGIMWSDYDGRDFSAENVVVDLHNVLEKININSIILVPHSLGGPFAMKYVQKYPEQVKGLVFVDTSHPDEIDKAAAISKEFGINTEPSGEFPTWIVKTASEIGLTRITGQDGEAKSILPEKEAQIAKAYFPQTAFGVINQTFFLNQIIKDSFQFRNLGDRPLINLVSARPANPTTKELEDLKMSRETFDKYWAKNTNLKKELNSESEKWSTNSKSVFVTDADHYIHLDNPEIVIKSVQEVMDSISSGGKLK
jgi:pimeloyl-ACP methyl ester carboxylesterase